LARFPIRTSDSLRSIIEIAAILSLVVWGVYSVTYVSTSPSDQNSLTNTILHNAVTVITSNGTSVAPYAMAQFVAFYRTTIPSNQVSGAYLFQNMPGYAFGPILWQPKNSNESYTQAEYLVLTLRLTSTCYSGSCVYIGSLLWLSGPQGNISQYMEARPFTAGAFRSSYSDIYILQVTGPGNYTLHYNNLHPQDSYTAAVNMDIAKVTFTHSRPYFIPGIASLVVAIALSATIVVDSRRKRKHSLQLEQQVVIQKPMTHTINPAISGLAFAEHGRNPRE
jgi:hypothetical protein